ncbi:hypothetical protein T4D_7276 [Trichinella pseudospiralis]|uniref:Uncharacterized protein n=1 Tax=Trichinella pseudospiralis TaxID=6337 RepID=A0A0V1G1J7_TRIPS|nr:hypothetical protein T4D_7276 [Trichinella pseudospiralis]
MLNAIIMRISEQRMINDCANKTLKTTIQSNSRSVDRMLSQFSLPSNFLMLLKDNKKLLIQQDHNPYSIKSAKLTFLDKRSKVEFESQNLLLFLNTLLLLYRLQSTIKQTNANLNYIIRIGHQR